jgi:hypothetical protein
MGIPLSLKASQLFAITMFCTFAFWVVYVNLCKKPKMEALYTSLMNQTLNGGSESHSSEEEKMVVAAQCVMAFFISTGMVIISINT